VVADVAERIWIDDRSPTTKPLPAPSRHTSVKIGKRTHVLLPAPVKSFSASIEFALDTFLGQQGLQSAPARRTGSAPGVTALTPHSY